MTIREVTVQVIVSYVTKVVSGSANEAYEKAKELVLAGEVVPHEINEYILDVQPLD